MSHLTYDRDVLVHVGSMRNVALHNRGFYFIKLALLSGSSAISPCGFFSCPPTLHSHVAGRKMVGPFGPESCDLGTSRIDDESFSTRAFLVRYRDEEHILNEGCSFRAENINALESSRMLLQIELHFCPLAALPLATESETIRQSIPGDATQYTCLATVNLCISKTSLLHDVVPVRFQQRTELEVAIHCDITRFSYGSRLADLLGPPESVSAETVWTPISSAATAAYLIDCLVKPVIMNRDQLILAIEPLLCAYRGLGHEEAENLKLRLAETTTPPHMQDHDLESLQQKLVSGSHDQEVLQEHVLSFIDAINAECSALYALVFSILPRIYPMWFNASLRAHQRKMADYWTRQSVTHIVPFANNWSQGCEEKKLLGVLAKAIALEKSLARGLPIFDNEFHRLMHRLPRALIQKFSNTSPLSQPALSEETAAKALSGPIHHIVCLQHGFLGNSYDMATLKNALAFEMSTLCAENENEKFHFLCAKSNDEDNQDSIENTATRLAVEVAAFISDKVAPGEVRDGNFRVSFIGHSLGGLVIRKALEAASLLFIHRRLHSYISLATPHLGTIYSDSPLVSVGMRALWQYQRSPALQQLVLEDGDDGSVAASCLFALSAQDVLKGFRHVVVVSALGDQYVPIQSARMQIDEKRVARDTKNGQSVVKMAESLYQQIGDPTKLIRITLDIGSTEDFSSVDNMIGRAAHISYLEHIATCILLAHLFMPLLVSASQ